MAELGLLGLKYPVEYGGRGGGYLEDAVLHEELGRSGSGGLSAGIGAHIGIATPPVWKFGTDDQKERFLAPAIRGERIAALGITEPGAGSDVAGIRTFARRVDGGYVVNGSKTFITNGVRADFVVTAVKTTEEGGHQGISFLILEREMDGLRDLEEAREARLAGVGHRRARVLRRVRARGEPARRGEPRLLPDHGQLPVGAADHGAGAVASMESVIERVVESEPGAGGDIAVAEMAVKHEASRGLTYHALRLFADGRERDPRGHGGEAALTALRVRGG